MKKRIWLLILGLAGLTAFGQTVSTVADYDTRALKAALKADVSSLAAAENYLYLSAGIVPSETARLLDEHMALAEHYSLKTEEFCRFRHKPEFLSIIPQWHGVRHIIVHSYKRGLAEDLIKRLHELHALYEGFIRTLTEDEKARLEPAEQLAWEILVQSYWLSVYYIAGVLEGQDKYKMKFLLQLDKYLELTDRVKEYVPLHTTRDFWDYMHAQMETLSRLVQDEQTDPEKVYQQTHLIYRNLFDLLQ